MNEEEARIRASLAEIDSIVAQMRARRDLNVAVQFAVRGLDIRRAYFGLGSHEFEAARLDCSRIVLEAASAQQILGKLKECAELLAQVDNFTVFALPEFPSLEFHRLLTRFKMMKELMITRHRQGRGRSALTFGRHLLDLGKKLYLVSELPTLHLNIAAVYAAMKMHQESLTHCYFGFQKTCMILNAVMMPSSDGASVHHDGGGGRSFVRTSLTLEECINTGKDAEAFELFEACGRLHVDEMDDKADAQAAVPPFEGQGELTPETCRWGGVLALAYRSIAVEQEHLEQFASSALTYKMAHTTAVACLGPTHPVSLQCEQSYKDAEAASKYRDRRNRAPTASGTPLKVVRVRSTARTILADLSKIDSPPPAASGGFSNIEATSSSQHVSRASGTHPHASLSSELPSRGGTTKRVARPLWNPWFNSSVPASEYAELTKFPHIAPCDRSRPVVSPAVGINLSALDQGDEFGCAVGPVGDPDPDATEIRGAGRASLNTTMQSQSSGGRISRRATGARGNKARARAAKNDGEQQTPSVSNEDQQGELPSLSPADYSFLVNTFKLPYDINLRRPQCSLIAQQGAGSRPQKSELRALTAERRLAEAMAAEMGLR